MHTLTVQASSSHYPIYIGQGNDIFLSLPEHLTGNQVMIVTNHVVAPLQLERIKALMPSQFQVEAVVLPDGEAHKHMQSIECIFDQLMAHRFNRNCTVLALGGGVVGDMAGFAAACYQRGVNFIQVPTTLLSQVDSSVGGKTGINHPLGKNMIGAFKQPSAVFIDTSVLNTLDARELSAGLAEVIKYALLGDADFLTWLETHMEGLVAKDSELIAQAIITSCQHKADIVARDEFENGDRALLNLGHTFGHAIETHMGYGTFLHGEAVAIGMLMAADLSMREGYITQADIARIADILKRANLPIQPPNDMPPSDFLNVMMHDKKNRSKRIRLILLKTIGAAFLSDSYQEDHLNAMLNHFYMKGHA